MATFGEMKTYISERLLDPNNVAVSSSSVAAAINDAIRYWKFRRFWFNEENGVVTLTSQDPVIPVPSNILVPAYGDDGFTIHYSNTRYPLEKIASQTYDLLYLNNGYGLPRWYARFGGSYGEYRVYPNPDQAYTMYCHYLKDYTALSSDSDTNDFTDYADRMICLWALANLSGELRQDSDMENYYRNAAMNEYGNLQVLTGKKNGSGKLAVYSTLT